jgi:ubiquinone biosynthesis protein
MKALRGILFRFGRVVFDTILVVILLVGLVAVRIVRFRSGPRRLRQLLESGGAGFVKLGQFLSIRWDLLPWEYCDELSHLLDRVSPLDRSVIVAEIERQFGKPLDECFRKFDAVPLGSASLAQVHGAELSTGEPVAVKILRPGIEQRIATDLWILKKTASFIDGTTFLGSIRLTNLIDELQRMTMEELDMRREARSADLLHGLMASDTLDHCAPKVYSEYVTARVLTMERFYGVSATDLLRAVQTDDRARLKELSERGVAPRRTARLLFRSIMEQAYVHRVFHADPHPSNLILLDGGTLAFIDFGMVGWLDEQLWSQQYQLFDCIAHGKIHQAYLAFVETLGPMTSRDLTSFEVEFKTLLRDWISAVQSSIATPVEKSTGRFLFQAVLAVRRAGLTLPNNVLRLHRATIVSDMIELHLFPQLNLMADMRDFFADESCRRITSYFRPDRLRQNIQESIAFTLRAPSFGLTVMDWTETRLPRIAQSIESDISRFDEVLGLAMSYLRFLVWASVPVVFLLWWLGGKASATVGPQYAWIHGLSSVLNLPLVLVWWAAAAFIGHALGQMINALRESD